jgi:predicted metal-dependent phosphoesterase TrpH
VRVDFHLHTLLSDGALEPHELIAAVRQERLEAWALTDHDTIDGVQACAGEPGLIAGVEVTAGGDGREIHVLGLGIAPAHPGLAALLAEIQALRRQRLAALIAHLPAQVGRGLDLAQVDDGRTRSLGRSHLARALVRRGAVRSSQEAFDRYLGDEHVRDEEGMPAFPAVAQVCAVIHAAGGVAILAHPGIYRSLALVEGLIAQGCDGLELSHPGLDPLLAAGLRELVRARRLLASLGSDLHWLGGRQPGMCTLEPELLAPLLDRLGLRAA